MAQALLILLVLSPCVKAQQSPAVTLPDAPASFTVRGIVVSSTDNKPIEGALVELQQFSKIGNLSMLTGKDGQFEFGNISPGNGTLRVQKASFLPQVNVYGNETPAPFRVTNQDLSMKVVLEPGSTITGRLTNNTGEPAAGIDVRLLRRKTAQGEYVGDELRHTTTDSNGRYQFQDIRPGTYWLQSKRVRTTNRPGMSLETGFSYVSTYYPGFSDKHRARPIVVSAGDQLTADWVPRREQFQLVIAPYSGRLADGAGSGQFWVSDDDGEPVSDVLWDHDTFRLLASVPRGHYKLYAELYAASRGEHWPDGTSETYFGYEEFTVEDKAKNLPEVPLRHPVTIPVHLQVNIKKEDRFRPKVAGDVWGSSQTVCIDFVDGRCWSMSAPNQKAPSLYFNHPGRFSINTYAPSGTYFASLTCGNIDLLREQLLVAGEQPACSTIEAMLRDDPASVEIGLDAEGHAAMAKEKAEYGSLLLIPIDSEVKLLPFGGLLFKGSETAKAAGISPGRYLAVILNLGGPRSVGMGSGWPPSPPYSPVAYRDPAVLQKLRACGKEITLHPDEQAHIEVGWCGLP